MIKFLKNLFKKKHGAQIQGRVFQFHENKWRVEIHLCLPTGSCFEYSSEKDYDTQAEAEEKLHAGIKELMKKLEEQANMEIVLKREWRNGKEVA